MNQYEKTYNSFLPNFLITNVFGAPVFSKAKYIIFNDNLKKNNSTCPICLGVPKQFFRPNSCDHYFCKKCLTHWLEIKNNCPISRRPFDEIFQMQPAK